MQTLLDENHPLWEASNEEKQQANITRYMRWLADHHNLHFQTREELWHWSVNHIEDFWSSLWTFFDIQASQPYQEVLSDHHMPGASWFTGARLNYAEHVFRNRSTEQPAIIFRSERVQSRAVSWGELTQKVSSLAQSLRALGVEPGDRVVSYMPNIPETTMAFLACASIGATWSSCSPDFGTGSVIDRFKQIEPKVLFSIDGYQYGGKSFDRLPILAELQQALPTVQKTILLPYLRDTASDAELAQLVSDHSLTNTVFWSSQIATPAELNFAQLPFDHPLWVLYSSGTTGLPKAIVQGHGGILLEHLKQLLFDINLKTGDRFFWHTTTGWMMWNLLVGGLLTDATILLYDGNPGYPDMNILWQFAHDSNMTFFGTSAGYITSCMKAAIEPCQDYDLSALRAIGSTGSPLPPEGFLWLYEHVKKNLWVASVSGGTDICSAFVTGSILLPVIAGELQCRSLGAKVESFDEQGHSLIDEVGELVITEPLPSMPLFFWNDPDNARYQDSYFSTYPGVWRHGDWIKITPRGSAVISGRSDSTINRMGIRMGSSEIYRVVEALPEILDSLIVGVELPHGRYYMPLFVVLRPGVTLDESLQQKIKRTLRSTVSPHHVPDEILAVPEVPRTLSGKKLEVPIKKLFMGIPAERAMSTDALANPQVIPYFVALAQRITPQP